MIQANATALKAQAIEIQRTPSGRSWCVYDAKGHLVAQLPTREAAIETARAGFYVRDNEWTTTQIECACKGVDFFCPKCGGHGTLEA